MNRELFNVPEYVHVQPHSTDEAEIRLIISREDNFVLAECFVPQNTCHTYTRRYKHPVFVLLKDGLFLGASLV